jgi:uncharacterized protein YciI
VGDEWIYVVRPTRPAMLQEGLTARERAVVEAHAAYLRELAARGVAVLFGRTDTTDERTFGLVVFRAPSEAAARATMAADPAIAGGVMRGELFPYRIVHPPRA